MYIPISGRVGCLVFLPNSSTRRKVDSSENMEAFQQKKKLCLCLCLVSLVHGFRQNCWSASDMHTICYSRFWNIIVLKLKDKRPVLAVFHFEYLTYLTKPVITPPPPRPLSVHVISGRVRARPCVSLAFHSPADGNTPLDPATALSSGNGLNNLLWSHR